MKLITRSIVLLAIILISCTPEEPDNTPENKLVQLNLSGDFLTNFRDINPSSGRISTEEQQTIIGIKVYRLNSAGEEIFYANGVFQDPDNIFIELNTADTYIIKAGAAKNGTSDGICLVSDILLNGFGKNNLNISEFFFEQENFFPERWNGFRTFSERYDIGCSGYEYGGKEIDFFYGISDPFQIEDNTVINTHLSRFSYGLGFEVPELTNGELLINLSSDGPQDYSITLLPSCLSDHFIRTFHSNFSAESIGPEQTHVFQVVVNYITRNDVGEILSNTLIGTGEIEVQRNVMRIFTFEVDESETGTNEQIQLAFSYDDEMPIENHDLILD
ncbi:MAG: hypothetical protein GY816_20060 [Cytophagales bacterium]|nr:hypothetical protein [Cytophagales bacterium]